MRILILFVFAAALAWGQRYVYNPFTDSLDAVAGTTGTAPYSPITITASPMTIAAVTHGHGTTPIMACYDTATPRAVIPAGSTNCNYTVSATGTIVLTYSVAPGLVLIYGGGTRGQAGATGSAGASGNTVLNGTVAPTSEGANGDFYLLTTTSCLYGPKAAGTWPGTCTSLVGPSFDSAYMVQYVTGSGAPASSGAATGNCRIGSSAPDYPIGSLTYIDTASGLYYGCTASNVWTAWMPLATKFKTVNFGYEVGAESAAAALATADLTNHAFKINDANAKTLVEASCVSDVGDQSVTVKIASTTLFSIHCVAPTSYSRSTTDGTTGFIVAASMGSTAIAAGAVLDLSGTANTTTKNVKLHIAATVN